MYVVLFFPFLSAASSFLPFSFCFFLPFSFFRFLLHPLLFFVFCLSPFFSFFFSPSPFFFFIFFFFFFFADVAFYVSSFHRRTLRSQRAYWFVYHRSEERANRL